MHITHVENFKAWLVENIRPLCDADPIPLSKYVLALVKKDKDEKELKSICNDQLDVFFQENTVEFVEKLFQVLKDESYDRPVAAAVAAAATPAAAPAASTDEEQQRRSATKRKASTSSASASATKQQQQQQKSPTAIGKEAAAAAAAQQRHSHPPESKVARVSAKSGTAAKPESEAAANAKRQLPVPVRPPSPPPTQQPQRETAPSSARGNSHSSSSSGQPPKDLRNSLNSRSTTGGSSGVRQHQQHSMPHQLLQQQQQQQQLPPMPTSGSFQQQQQQQPFLPPPPLPPPASSAVGYYPAPLPPPPPPHLMVPPQQQRPRCRDYDEKGVCLLGAACPYDHGAHPLIVAPGDPAYGKFFPAAAAPAQTLLPPPPPPPPSVSSQHHGSMMQPVYSNAPLASSASHASNTQPQLHQQSQLAQQATIVSQQPMDAGPTLSVSSAASTSSGAPARIVQPIAPDAGSHLMGELQQLQQQQQAPQRSSTLPLTVGRQQQRGNNSCTLELRRVPAALNNPASLGGHFCRFGTIVDMDIVEPEAARVTFSSPAEALAAYRSPEAVLNNRFIRVFLPGAGGGGGGQRQSAKDRLGARHQQQQQQQHSNSRRQANLRQTSTTSSDGGDDEHASASDDSALAAAAPSRASLTWTPHSAEAAAKAAETAAAAAAERRQEGARIQQAQQAALERAKAQRELRVKQISMLKDCKESLAKLGNLFAKAKDADARHAIAETMKPINAQIRDLEASLGVVSTGSAALRDLQKELLDLELEVYQKEGLEPVADQKKRLAEVRKLLAARLPPKPAPAAQPVPNFAQTRLDKRSRTLRVQGHDPDGQVDELLRHIAVQAGVKPQRHLQCPDGQLLVDFAGRADAEAVMARLKSFADKPLKVEWSQRPAATAAAATPSAASTEAPAAAAAANTTAAAATVTE